MRVPGSPWPITVAGAGEHDATVLTGSAEFGSTARRRTGDGPWRKFFTQAAAQARPSSSIRHSVIISPEASISLRSTAARVTRGSRFVGARTLNGPYPPRGWNWSHPLVITRRRAWSGSRSVVFPSALSTTWSEMGSSRAMGQVGTASARSFEASPSYTSRSDMSSRPRMDRKESRTRSTGMSETQRQMWKGQ